MPGENVKRQHVDMDGLSGSLARLVECAPYKPYCSDNKTASRILPFYIARHQEYIQINPPSQVYWLIFDIDFPNPHIWEDVDLPPPNIITISPDTAKSHLCYAIEPVCVSRNGSHKAIAYMKAVRRAYAKALNADLDYNSPVTKNPLHPRWKVWCPTEHVYSLGELADYRNIDLSVNSTYGLNKHSPVVQDMEDPQGRNCTLFLQLRMWAYSEVADAKQSDSYDRWKDRVLDKAERLNSLIGGESNSGPLPYSEIKATAKSVSRWTWEYYTGSSIDRGVMAMAELQLPLVNKQRLSARRTHTVRRNKTVARISAAVRLLHASKEPISRIGIAKASGLSRQTVARYWPEVQALIEQLNQLNEQDTSITCVHDALVRSVSNGETVTLSGLSRSTGIDRRVIKSRYPSLFDP